MRANPSTEATLEQTVSDFSARGGVFMQVCTNHTQPNSSRIQVGRWVADTAGHMWERQTPKQKLISAFNVSGN